MNFFINCFIASLFILNACSKNSPDCSHEKRARISSKSYVILESRGHGMFSILDDVLSLLYAYEKGEISGVEIDFGTTGLYYDSKRGRFLIILSP